MQTHISHDATAIIYEEQRTIKAIDCDVNLQPKPAVLFRLLSEAAGTHAERLGVGLEAMVAQGLLWVHARMRVAFYASPRLDDVITIRTWPKAIERRLRYIRDFEVLDVGGQRLAAATSAWLVVDAETHRIVRPDAVNLTLPALADQVGLDEPLERLSLEEIEDGRGEERLRVRAGYSAVDILGHVNNSRYVEWICDAFPMAMYRERQLDRLQINYLHEVLPDEEVAVVVDTVSQEPGLWAVAGLNRANDTRAFEALVRWRGMQKVGEPRLELGTSRM